MKLALLRAFSLSPLTSLCLLLSFLFCLPLNSLTQTLDWEKEVLENTKTLGNFNYVSIQDLAEILQVQTYYSNKVRKAILYLNEKITITANNPYLLVGQTVMQMPVECRFFDGDFYIPVKFFLPIVRNMVQAGLSDEFANGTADLAGPNVIGVKVEEKANGTLIRIQTRKQFAANTISTRYSRKWLYVEFLDGRLDAKTFSSQFEKGLVQKVKVSQLEQMAQISLRLRKDIANASILVRQAGNEVWVSIHTNDELDADLVEQLKSDQKKWRIDKIVIDPGHGGRDPGAIGRGGVKEKDVVLAIAKRLKTLLEQRLNIKVFMTRDRDVYIPLRKRTQFANKVGGKLFISIHANSNRSRRVKGATTYFLGPARSEEALEIAARENSVIKYDEDKDDPSATEESLIFAAMAQNEYNKESQDFAALIQKAIRKETKINDRGVKQAGFYVLVGASMPNVLVETAFISNRSEVKLLKSSSFQNKIAKAIYESVRQFKERHEGF